MMQNNYSQSKTVQPAGIWILTVYAGLIFGLLLPIIYHLQISFPYGRTPFEIMPSLIAPLLIILSAYLVWAGREDARFWLLVVLSLYSYAIGITIAALLWSGFVPPSFQLLFLGLVIHNLFIPPFYYAYFARQKATLSLNGSPNMR